MGSSPTAPTIWSFRVRVPQGCGLVSFGRRWARTREGASVKRTRSVRSEPARTPTGGRSRCVFAQQIRRRPTAPTIWLLRARVPGGCGLVSFGRRGGSNPRGGERQADAQRPQRAGEGANRRPKPVRICAANTQTSHRPYHLAFTSPCPPGMRARFLWMPVDFRSCGGIVPVLTGYQPI